jgi:hypothetical protein
MASIFDVNPVTPYPDNITTCSNNIGQHLHGMQDHIVEEKKHWAMPIARKANMPGTYGRD